MTSALTPLQNMFAMLNMSDSKGEEEVAAPVVLLFFSYALCYSRTSLFHFSKAAPKKAAPARNTKGMLAVVFCFAYVTHRIYSQACGEEVQQVLCTFCCGCRPQAGLPQGAYEPLREDL